MELEFIEKLIKLVDEHDIASFEYYQSGEKLRILRRHPPSHSSISHTNSTSQPIAFATEKHINPHIEPETVATKSVPSEPQSEVSDNIVEIKSPMVGTFYRAPTPDADPYVEVGDHTHLEQILCIIEAMKLMNELHSEYSGKIVEILVENAQPVEYGQPLFLLEKD